LRAPPFFGGRLKLNGTTFVGAAPFGGVVGGFADADEAGVFGDAGAAPLGAAPFGGVVGSRTSAGGRFLVAGGFSGNVSGAGGEGGRFLGAGGFSGNVSGAEGEAGRVLGVAGTEGADEATITGLGLDNLSKIADEITSIFLCIALSFSFSSALSGFDNRYSILLVTTLEVAGVITISF
jgi:hypothetical protein